MAKFGYHDPEVCKTCLHTTWDEFEYSLRCKKIAVVEKNITGDHVPAFGLCWDVFQYGGCKFYDSVEDADE